MSKFAETKENPVQGSPEDLKLTLEALNEFFTEKLKSVDMYRKTGTNSASTDNTQSVCHVDGTTDCN